MSCNLLASNLFTYCFNNPVNKSDYTGLWPEDDESDFLEWLRKQKKKIFRQQIADAINELTEDLANLDMSNENPDVVFSSNYIAGYKGTLVIKTTFDTSFSIGFIGLSTYQQEPRILDHEYGHVVQFREKGVLKFANDVILPSLGANVLDRIGKLEYDYYGSPWESEADRYGGVDSKYWGTPWPKGSYRSIFDIVAMLFK